jgi:hypothetical protein
MATSKGTKKGLDEQPLEGGGSGGGMSSKMSSWMEKQVKERPAGYSKKEIEDEMFRIKAGRMNREELATLARSKGKNSYDAASELYRRDYNQIVEKDKNKTGKKATEEDTLGKAPSTKDYSEWKKGVESRQASKKTEDMAKGGMVKKKSHPFNAVYMGKDKRK